MTNRMGVPPAALSFAVLLLAAAPACAQGTNDPFPNAIARTDGVILVDFVEFAQIPDADGDPARMMILYDEPGTGQLFVNDMRGAIYSVSYNGSAVREYVNINDAGWGISVHSRGSERGFQSFAFHPQFGEAGAPGYGKFYTWTDTDNTRPTPDFTPAGGDDAHDTVLHEWTARDAAAATYDGGDPRELFRFQQPFGNHNGGQVGFNPTASPGDLDFGMLYVGSADGGSGGDPLNLSQNLNSGFGKILRIDPLGTNSANGKYGIPSDNPFANDGNDRTLGEIYAYGARNPQRFGWDPETGAMYMADIGQNIVEKLTLVESGDNLGWNDWEGSYRFVSRQEVRLDGQRSDANVRYPVAEYDQQDPLLQRSSAATGVHVYRSSDIPQLEGLILWGDNPSGEIFYVSADDVPSGGQDVIHRILLNDGGEPKTLLELVQEKNESQGRSAASRVDLRFGSGPNGQVFLLNKRDGVVRMLVPSGS